MNIEEKIKELDKEIRKVGLIESPGSIMVGLGLYGKFAANGDAFHPLLNNMTIIDSMLVVGGLIMIWGTYKIISLSKEKMKLAKGNNL